MTDYEDTAAEDLALSTDQEVSVERSRANEGSSDNDSDGRDGPYGVVVDCPFGSRCPIPHGVFVFEGSNNELVHNRNNRGHHRLTYNYYKPTSYPMPEREIPDKALFIDGGEVEADRWLEDSYDDRYLIEGDY